MTDEWTREKILKLGSAFWGNKILLTAAELNIFSKLGKDGMTVDDLCRSEGWYPRGVTILLDALAAMGFIRKSADGFYKTPEPVLELLGDSGQNSVLPMLLHMAHLWGNWTNLPDIVRGEKSSKGAGSHKWSEKETEAFIGAMDVIARSVAGPVIADLGDLSGFRRLLDIGGGPGAYTAAFLDKNPKMTATLFDRSNVIAIAKRRLQEKGLIDRVEFIEGDFNLDPLPNGHDLVWGSAVIHSNSREQNLELFKRVHAALSTGGRFLLRDHFLDTTRTAPLEGAIFAVNMLAVTEAGNCYTFNEVKDDLVVAGFHDVEMIRNGTRMDQVVSAVK